MSVVVDDPTEWIAVLWNGPALRYEKIALQKPVAALARLAGTASHSAGTYSLFESEMEITACRAEVDGCGAIRGRQFRALIAAQPVR